MGGAKFYTAVVEVLARTYVWMDGWMDGWAGETARYNGPLGPEIWRRPATTLTRTASTAKLLPEACTPSSSSVGDPPASHENYSAVLLYRGIPAAWRVYQVVLFRAPGTHSIQNLSSRIYCVTISTCIVPQDTAE